MGLTLDEAKELTQETWARLWAQHERGRLEDLALPGLAVTQARFLALDARRRERLAARADEAAVEPTSPSHEERFAAAQTLAELRRALDAMPEARRRAFELAHEGVPHADIARRLGFTPRRVRQLLWEIRSQLRARFGNSP